jgi:acetyltransferase-like isoleucine patch superfamily enzyme
MIERRPFSQKRNMNAKKIAQLKNPIIKRKKVPLQKQLHRQDQSLLKRYQQRVLSNERLSDLIYYEFATFLAGGVAGAVGFLLRKQLYPRLFKYFGQGVIIGRGVTLRHADRIRIGDRVAVDDYALLDAQGTGSEGIRIDSDAIISRNCVIQGKTGPVTLKAGVDIGCHTIISSVSGITIGKDALIAGHCYIGGARYNWQRMDSPISQQGQHSKGPIVIGDDVWLGAGVSVLDGVTIGTGCIVGAGAVVTVDIPAYSIATGIPAQVVGTRIESAASP